MMNAQIPSGLQALLQASQVLQQQAAPTAPGPQGPQPTVASKVNQQIQQTAAPQDMMPGMRDMGQQAGIAGQIMAQKQAQQQQMAQNPQAVAQMAAQMLQGQGVAGLPSNMQFKEGGIIGFDGRKRSDVPDPDEEKYWEEAGYPRVSETGERLPPAPAATPAGRWLESLKPDVKTEALRKAVAADYDAAAGVLGLFKEQTPEQREHAKLMAARVEKMSPLELRTYSGRYSPQDEYGIAAVRPSEAPMPERVGQPPVITPIQPTAKKDTKVEAPAGGAARRRDLRRSGQSARPPSDMEAHRLPAMRPCSAARDRYARHLC